MSQHRFLAADFTPTKWNTAEDKAKFANHLMAFIAADFPGHKFTKAFYEKLSNCYSFIAHYNRDGFWSTYFTNNAQKLDFLNHIVRYPCFGGPDFTFCDAERVTSDAIRSIGYVAIYQTKLAQEVEYTERVLLAQLQSKYQGGPKVVERASEGVTLDESVSSSRPLPPMSAIAPVQDVQILLFG
jgi:hypothetical protein